MATMPLRMYTSTSAKTILLPILNLSLFVVQVSCFALQNGMAWGEAVEPIRVVVPIVHFDISFLFEPNLNIFYARYGFFVLVMLAFDVICYFDLYERLRNIYGRFSQTDKQADANVARTRWAILVSWWILYLSCTSGVLPICMLYFETVACTRTENGWKWDLFPSVTCYEGQHLALVAALTPLFLLFLPFATRLAAIGGNASLMNADSSLTTLQRLKSNLCKSLRNRARRVNGGDLGFLKLKMEGSYGESQTVCTWTIIALSFITVCFAKLHATEVSVGYLLLSVGLLGHAIFRPVYAKPALNIVIISLYSGIVGIFSVTLWTNLVNLHKPPHQRANHPAYSILAVILVDTCVYMVCVRLVAHKSEKARKVKITQIAVDRSDDVVELIEPDLAQPLSPRVKTLSPDAHHVESDEVISDRTVSDGVKPHAASPSPSIVTLPSLNDGKTPQKQDTIVLFPEPRRALVSETGAHIKGVPKWRQVLRGFVQSRGFSSFIIFCILVNCVVLVLQAPNSSKPMSKAEKLNSR